MGNQGGRPRKPRKILELSGQYRKDRHADRVEPIPPAGVPEMPAGLDAEGRDCWSRLCERLTAMGLLTTADRESMTAYCESWSTFTRAQAAWHRVKSNDFHTHGARRIWSTVNAAQVALLRYAREFGFTPSARAGLSRSEVGSRTEFEEFIGNRPQIKPPVKSVG